MGAVKLPLHLRLFLSFVKIGALSFGGGYSMLPMFRRELVEKNGWLTDSEVADYFSVSQCLPGLIACNTAVFTGYKQAKITGGVTAALGVVFPSVVFILIIAVLISGFSDIPVVQHAFAGIRVCVGILIIDTVIKLFKQAVAGKLAIIVFSAVFLASVFTDIPVALLVVSAGLVGITVSALRKKAAK